MKKEEIISFVESVVNAIQTDYAGTSESEKSLISLLEKADEIHFKLTGKKIVKRKTNEEKVRGKSLLEAIAGGNPLKKIN